MLATNIESRASRADVARHEARLAFLVEAVKGGLWFVDLAAKRFICTPELSLLFTGSLSGELDQALIEAAVEEVDRDYANFIDLCAGRCERKTVEYHAATPMGRRLMVCSASLIRDSDGTPMEVIGLVRDITEERARENAARIEAETDPLTGLLNRRGLDRRVASTSADMPLGIVAIDLDRFKQVNDRHGHAAGDAMLIEIAATLRSVVRELDIVARLGGDEFLIVLPGADDVALSKLTKRLWRALGEKVRAGVTVSASVGSSIGQLGDLSFAALVARADRALYRSKAAARPEAALAP